MRVNVNGFRLRFQADREQVAVHVQAHGGSMAVASTGCTLYKDKRRGARSVDSSLANLLQIDDIFLTMSRPLDLLAIAPHPDDAELFCGGLICLMSKRHRVGILDLSRGELSSRGDLKTRARETARATKTLGVCWRENLALPDGAVGFTAADMPLDTQLQALIDTLRRVRPEMLLAPYQEDRHPDHEGASSLVTRAAFLAGLSKWASPHPAHQIKEIIFYPIRVEPQPTFIVDITSCVRQKHRAIECYKSQLHRSGRESKDSKTLLSSPLQSRAREGREHYFGSMIGVTAGEPYLVRGPLNISDPIKFFRSAPLAGALSMSPLV